MPATNSTKSSSAIVFGGSFDPPHRGHIELTHLAHVLLPEAQVVVVPAFRPALRVGVDKRNVATWEHRLAMTQAAWKQEQSQGWLRVTDLERRLPAPSYTVRTLQELSASYRELYLLIGMDQLQSFFQWKKPLTILELAHLVVGGRRLDANPSVPADAVLVEECARSLGLKGQWDENGRVFRLDGMGHHIHLVGSVTCAASSTELRKRAQAGAPMPKGWLPPGVIEYLTDHRVYAPVQTEG